MDCLKQLLKGITVPGGQCTGLDSRYEKRVGGSVGGDLDEEKMWTALGDNGAASCATPW